jgi:hypothetical protein
MARFKPAGSRKAASSKRSNLSFIPCLIVIVLGLALVFILFYALLTSGK